MANAAYYQRRTQEYKDERVRMHPCRRWQNISPYLYFTQLPIYVIFAINIAHQYTLRK